MALLSGDSDNGKQDRELQSMAEEGNKESLRFAWGRGKVAQHSLHLIILKMVRVLQMSQDADKDS